MIRTVLVDDEPLAREGLRLALANQPDVEIVGECGNGEDAVLLVASLQPDLIFLDVRMPGCDGFEALERMAAVHLPRVIFLTAFDTHAVRAFEVHALDYLLKPAPPERIEEAVRRARADLSLGEAGQDAERVADWLAAGVPGAGEPRPRVRHMVARERSRMRLVEVGAIRWVRSAGNYIEVCTGESEHLVRMRLAEAEDRLAAEGFARIHRSVLVRVALVRSVVPTEGGDFRAILDDGRELPLSRRYRDALLPPRRAAPDA